MKLTVRRVAWFLLISYLFILSYWMLLGFGRTPGSEYMYNLKPLMTIRHFMQMDQLSTTTWVINLMGNIGVFIPFGILLPILFQKSLSKVFVIFVCGLFVLESLQLLTRRGSFDIDDFILNSIGFMMGYWIYGAVRGRYFSKS